MEDRINAKLMMMGEVNNRSASSIKARVLEVKELTTYQKDSIVSRTLIDKEAGTVTIFALDKGQGLSEHTAPYDAMVMVLEGNAEVTISGKTLRLGENEMMIMPANKPHSLKAIERFMMMLVMVRS